MNRKACGENYGKRIGNDLRDWILTNISIFPNQVITLAVARKSKNYVFGGNRSALTSNYSPEKGESMVSTSKTEISACTHGEHNSLPLMKGERSWCCHQVQRGRLLAFWHKFGAMAQVLSLMATLFGNRSQFRHSERRKRHIRRFT